MNWLPPQLMKVSALVLPGDIKARQKQPHVIELAESIGKRTGKRPIHLPTVEYPSKELLSGADRMAAQLILGYRSVWVQPVSQLTPQERRDIVRDENLHRRVIDRDVLIRQRVEEAAAEIEAARLLEEVERKPGRPKSAKGEAREQVAKQLGTTPDAIRVAEARAVAEELPNKYSDTPISWPVETYGLPLVTDGESAEIQAFQGAIDDADKWLRRAQAALASQDDGPFAGHAQQLLAQVHQVAAEVRRNRPAAVCPYCKRLPHFIPGCNGCRSFGFVGADAMLGVADELKLGGDKAMVVALGGRMVSYAYAATGKEAKAAKPKKQIKILGPDDKPLAPVAEPVPTVEIGDEGLPF
jgi:hypothetical protein